MKLSAAHVPRDLIHHTLASRYFFVLSSRSDEGRFADFFRGTGFARSGVVFGAAGFRAFRAAHPDRFLSDELEDGRFVIGEARGKAYILKSDPMGKAVLYLWREGAQWAVSNSLYVLAREVECLGHRPRINPGALAVFSAGTGGRDHGQPISPNTALSGAVTVPLGHALHISFSSREPRIELVQDAAFEIGERGARPYLNRLNGFIDTWRNRFATLAHHGVKLHLELSGGKDSRAVLAIMKSCLNDRDIVAHTNRDGSEDMPIAQAIMNDHVPRQVSAPVGNPTPSLSESLALHLMSVGGVRRTHLCDYLLEPLDYCTVTGGASFDTKVFRSPFARRIGNAQNTRLIRNEGIRAEVIAQYHAGLEPFPCEASDPSAILFHYCGYRSRFHYGMRTFLSNAQVVSPLHSRDMVDIVLSAPTMKYVSQSGINYDIVDICAPYLRHYPVTGRQDDPKLVSRTVPRRDLPRPAISEVYGTPNGQPPRERYSRVYGPGGKTVLENSLTKAIDRFGYIFEDSVTENARMEIEKGRDMAQCRNAFLLCSLDRMF
ncbi:hypothetical protein [Oceaniglobus trochenteri]|uniref:hypothetical protein n=1 Tax=Oceaniglobus trochenteri TaxID=2763260 RepID=UPI001CFFAF02|nr:hypothetical protein [Oceaniglobus trochenteri]